MKKIMVLGAGIYQVPLIRKIREMGYYSIVCSIPGRYPGFSLADRACYVDTTDEQSILKIAREEQISAILTSGTDVAVRTIGRVCEELGLCGISRRSAMICTDKYLTKQAFADKQVSTAEFHRIDNLQQAYDACDQMGYPVMIKCVDSSGSRGISKVSGRLELEDAVQDSFSYTRQPYLVAEKFIEGHEIGLDGYVGDSTEDIWMVLHDKLVVSNGHTNIPAGHIFPYTCTPALEEKIRHEAKKAVDATGLTRCFFNMDILISGETPYILEVGGRTGATCIPELISLYAGFDVYRQMVLSALGEHPDFTEKSFRCCGAKLLFSEQEGILRSVSLPKENPPETQVQMDYAVGETVPKFCNGANRIGHLICCGKNCRDVRQKLRMLESNVQIRLESC